MSTKQLKIGVLTSGDGGGHLKRLITFCRSGKVNAKVVFVGTDNPQAEVTKIIQEKEIPFTFLLDYGNDKHGRLPADFKIGEAVAKQRLFNHSAGYWPVRNAIIKLVRTEEKFLKAIESFPDLSFDLLMLIDFKKWFTPYLIDRININPVYPRIITISPSLFPGISDFNNYYEELWRRGCSLGGCTAYFVDYGRQSGPIIGQQGFSIQGGWDIEKIREEGTEAGWELLRNCVQILSQNKLVVTEEDIGRKVVNRV